MSEFQNQRGFTFIEAIVVIAMLGILAVIAVPRFFGYIERAQLSADQATLRTLNSMTLLSRMNLSLPDPFGDGTKGDEALIGFLVDSGYLASTVKPQSKDAAFAWLIDEQRWYLNFGGAFYIIGSRKDDIVLVRHSGIQQLVGPYSGTASEIMIPATLNGVTIDGVWQYAFRVHYGSTTEKLKSVRFADDSQIEVIGRQSFINNLLTEISLPESLQTIGDRAFRSNFLTEILLPNNISSIGDRAFELNPDLEKVSIGAGVTIGDNAFGSNNLFRDAYLIGGAGSYIWDGEYWIKQGD